MTRQPQWITACIPTYRCNHYLRLSVLSLLRQKYPYVRVVVINDGDPETPWSVLWDITDPRLVRFTLSERRGPYFAMNVALAASPDPLFLVQDADDWSAPDRVMQLLGQLEKDKSNYAYSMLAQFYDAPTRSTLPPRLFSDPAHPIIDPSFRLRIPHHGLFRSHVLRSLGGYYGGFPFGYDELLTNLVLMTGRVSRAQGLLYWRRVRATSLTRSPITGMASSMRKAMRSQMGAIYEEVYRDYLWHRSSRISGEDFVQRIRQRVQQRIPQRDWATTASYASKLRTAMGERAQ